MGSNHFSHIAYGASLDEVRDLLVQWLRAKGYPLQDGPPRATLHPKHERGLRLIHRGDTVVVLYSEIAEFPRLLFELKKLPGPVLEWWMHDSDIWGYQLHDRGRCTSAFNSMPDYGGLVEELPADNDVDAVCVAAGAAGQADALRALQKKRAVFAEGISAEAATLLGAAPAANLYAYESVVPKGWSELSLWFRSYDYHPMQGFDLDAITVAPIPDPRDQWTEEERAAMEAAQQRALRWGWVWRLLFWPITAPFRLWLWWRFGSMRQQLEAGEMPELPGTTWSPMFVREGDVLISEAHGLRMPLPEGAVVDDRLNRRYAPEQIFLFRHGEVGASVSAMRPDMARNLGLYPAGAVVTDTRPDGTHWPARAIAKVVAGTEDQPGNWEHSVVLHLPDAVVLVRAQGAGAEPEGIGEVVLAAVRGLRPL